MGSQTERGARPSGLVTFLFTDVEDSTRAWETDPTAMSGAMARHHELLEAQIERHHGVRALEQGGGDSIVAAFERPSDAVRAAVTAQQDLTAESWPGWELRVRMVVHTGEVVVNDDGTYAGPTMNRCGRLLAAAHGGQVLASRPTRDVAADVLGDLVSFRDLGSHRLRGIEEPIQVFQIGAEGLAADFPPLRTLDGTPHNLPTQFTSFVGRDADRQRLADLIVEVPVVTVAGSGGCGKTRLALEACSDLIDRFDDGVWFADLAPVTEDEAVLVTVAQALRVRVPHRGSVSLAITEHLAGRRAIVLLDNCEHVLDICAQLAVAIRSACPDVRVVATSREPLGVPGETVWRIPSLTVPAELTVEAVTHSEAGELFVARARLAQPTFVLTESEAPALSEICRRLDGIPLAIELAAARVASLPPAQLASNLDDRFRLLSGGGRTLLPRQRTLEASVGWSHQLLATEEQVLLRRLSVFSGGWTLEAAEHVTADEVVPSDRVMGLISRLVDKSLVTVVADQPGHERYAMLETVRQFARDRLIDAGEADPVRLRHLGWFRAWSRREGEQLEGRDTVEHLRLVDAEVDNLRAALRWAEATADHAATATIVGSLVWFWLWRGLLRETWNRLDRLEPDLERLPNDLRLLALWCRSWLAAHFLGRHDLIEQACTTLRTAAQYAGDARYEARALGQWGTHLGFRDRGAAESVLIDARELARQAQDPYWEAYVVGGLALLHELADRHDLARPYVEEMEVMARTSGSPQLLAEYLTRRALVESRRGDLGAARRAVEELFEVYDPISDGNIVAVGHIVAADLGLHAGRPDPGRLEVLLERYLRTEELQHVPMTVCALVDAYLAEGRVSAAAELIDPVWDNRELQATPSMRVWLGHWRAVTTWASGDLNLAADRLASNHEDAVAYGNLYVAAADELYLGIIARFQGEHRRAEGHFQSALRALVDLDCRIDLAWCLEELAGLWVEAGRAGDALHLMAAAATYRGDTGATFRPIRQDAYLADLAAARAKLGHEADRIWEEGEQLSLGAAVELATRARGRRGRPALGWDALTPTELRIADLVVDGMSNRQIASTLLMGPETVKTHLSRVYQKLDLHGRTELAVAASRRRPR